MARKRSRSAHSPARPRRRLSWGMLALLVAAAAAAAALWPRPRAWHSLGPGLGRIRWVETRTDVLVEHPLAPAWILDLRRRGIPWPTDLPLEPLGGSFGAPGSGETTAAWYLVQSARPSMELWYVDKSSLRLTNARGGDVPLPGGAGALLIDSDRRLQYLYLGVPRELSGSGARLRFRLARYQGDRSREVVLPF